MEGLINFANEVAATILVWLGAFCYFGGAAAIIGGCFLLHETHRLQASLPAVRPWMAWAVFLCGFLMLGLPEFINLGTASIGGAARAAYGNPMTSYTAPDGRSWLGLGPLETMNAVIQSFILFFRALGASWVFQAIARARRVNRGEARGSHWFSVVKFACGIAVVNIDTVSDALARSAGAGA